MQPDTYLPGKMLQFGTTFHSRTDRTAATSHRVWQIEGGIANAPLQRSTCSHANRRDSASVRSRPNTRGVARRPAAETPHRVPRASARATSVPAGHAGTCSCSRDVRPPAAWLRCSNGAHAVSCATARPLLCCRAVSQRRPAFLPPAQALAPCPPHPWPASGPAPPRQSSVPPRLSVASRQEEVPCRKPATVDR